MEREIWNDLGAQGLVIVGLNTGGLSGTDSHNIADFIAQTGVTFPIATDDGNTFGAWAAGPAISPFPLDVVVDRTGVVRYLTREYNAAELRAAIERAL